MRPSGFLIEETGSEAHNRPAARTSRGDRCAAARWLASTRTTSSSRLMDVVGQVTVRVDQSGRTTPRRPSPACRVGRGRLLEMMVREPLGSDCRTQPRGPGPPPFVSAPVVRAVDVTRSVPPTPVHFTRTESGCVTFARDDGRASWWLASTGANPPRPLLRPLLEIAPSADGGGRTCKPREAAAGRRCGARKR